MLTCSNVFSYSKNNGYIIVERDSFQEHEAIPSVYFVTYEHAIIYSQVQKDTQRGLHVLIFTPTESHMCVRRVALLFCEG